jgi:hypothetical protein
MAKRQATYQIGRDDVDDQGDDEVVSLPLRSGMQMITFFNRTPRRSTPIPKKFPGDRKSSLG